MKPLLAFAAGILLASAWISVRDRMSALKAVC
jgi:hypothetical protein